MNTRCVLAIYMSMAVLLMCFTTAQAVSTSHTWDFSTTCYGVGACNDTFDPVGNVRTAPSDNGLNVSVRAFSFTNPSGTGPSIAGWLGQYLNPNGGLGVTNSSGDNSHTVDNVGYSDYVVFEFNAPVNVTGYYMSFIVDDADTTWYVGDLAPGFNFSGLTLAQVDALGLTKGTNSWSSSGDPSPSETISTGVNGNYFILAARLDQTDKDDKFKIRTITAAQQTADPVPEPGTLILLASGLTLLGFVARRRANKLKAAQDAGDEESV